MSYYAIHLFATVYDILFYYAAILLMICRHIAGFFIIAVYFFIFLHMPLILRHADAMRCRFRCRLIFFAIIASQPPTSHREGSYSLPKAACHSSTGGPQPIITSVTRVDGTGSNKVHR